jgi:hypothetical protein
MDGVVIPSFESDETTVLWESGHNQLVLHGLKRIEVVGGAPHFEVYRMLVFKHLHSFIAHARTGLVDETGAAGWTRGLFVSWTTLHLIVQEAIVVSERMEPACQRGDASGPPLGPRIRDVAAAELLRKLIAALGRCNPARPTTELTEEYLRELERFDSALTAGGGTAVDSMVWMIAPGAQPTVRRQIGAPLDQYAGWYTVTQAGEQLVQRYNAMVTGGQEKTLEQAKALVSGWATADRFVSNGEKWGPRRINPVSFNEWLDKWIEKQLSSQDSMSDSVL